MGDPIFEGIYPLNKPFYFSGQNAKFYACSKIGEESEESYIVLDNVQYIQITPVQNAMPVFSVFSDKPTMFLKGNYLVQGTIGFNMQFADMFDVLIDNGYQRYLSEGMILYIEKLKLELQQPVYSSYKSIIELSDVILTGGSIQQLPDQTPMQTVYSFAATSITRRDEAVTLVERPEESLE